MADHCVATILEDEDFRMSCGGACRRGNSHCKYWLVDPVWHIMSEWKVETKEEFMMYKIDYANEQLLIGTTKPGLFIGYKGERFFRYRDRLSKLLGFKRESFIKFVEFTEIV